MSIRNTAQLHRATRSLIKATQRAHVHQLLGVIIVVAHASEIVRVVSHISLWHLAAAVVVFSLWLATQKNAIEELA